MSQRNELRVFISSTFRDLQEEREHLVKKVFPEIRTLCRERGVEFTEIDLRWGLTQEEVTLGRVIRTCLEEIDRCRPYFIGLLGDRYGWAPMFHDVQKDPELLARYPWMALSEQLHKPDTLFSGRVLLARIEATEGAQEQALKRLAEMLDEASDDEQRAELHYWMGRVARQVSQGDRRGDEEHSSEALRLYRSLLEKTPKHEYKKRIGELAASHDCVN